MSKYELAISPDYVPTWTITDAVRELFQNALDQQTTVPNNEMFWGYTEENQTLAIGNKRSRLTAQSLLLGTSTKANDKTTIGKYGEGYKIATLVLLRAGRAVTFYNYGAKEVWKPRFVNSKKYGAQILTFFVDRPKIWEKVPHHNLSIEVSGITERDLIEIQMTNLHMKKPNETIETSFGSILKEPKYIGKVFVNGLYVCTNDKLKYGYNFKPEYVELDRDRKLISDFNLQWLCSRTWGTLPNSPEVLDLIKTGVYDVAYLNYHSDVNTLGTRAYDDFVASHGTKAVPIQSNEELKSVPRGYTPVIVNPTAHHFITHAPQYESVLIKPEATAPEQLREWYDSIMFKLEQEDRDKFEEIWALLESEV